MTDTTRDELLAAAEYVMGVAEDRCVMGFGHAMEFENKAHQVAEAYLANQHQSPINAKLLAACEAAVSLIEQQPLRDIWLPKHAGGVEMAMECEAICDIHETLQTALAAARAQAEYDAKPVDDVWLGSIGFVAGTAAFVIFTLAQIRCWRVGITNRDEWQWRCGLSVIREQKTRGDVRRLLAALGVEAK